MATTTVDLQGKLDAPYALTPAQVTQFREQGFIKLKDVFDGEVLDYYGAELTRLTLERNPLRDVPLERRDTYGKAFIQVGNLWEMSPTARALSFSKRLARLAAELMGVDGVRMWHDQALYKEAGGGFTPWHVDQYYWPMSSGKSVTAWVPLQAVPMAMGPLCFAKGSHVKYIARDIAISDESERLIREQIKEHKLIEVMEPFDLGEVSFHYGWTLHRAGPNTTGAARKVHTVIYMDAQMRLIEPRNPNHEVDWKGWTPSTKVGEVMADAKNPVLWGSGGS